MADSIRTIPDINAAVSEALGREHNPHFDRWQDSDECAAELVEWMGERGITVAGSGQTVTLSRRGKRLCTVSDVSLRRALCLALLRAAEHYPSLFP